MAFDPFSITCPHCMAKPREPCFEYDGSLTATHKTRQQGEIRVGDRFKSLSAGTILTVTTIPRDGDVVVESSAESEFLMCEEWLYDLRKYRKLDC